jgi:hypothetical protein
MALNVSLLLPEDIIDHLGSGDEQWKPGRPAYEIAYSWYDAAGIPKSVQAVLDTDKLYRGAQMLDGFFERKVAIAPGAESQTDLMVIAAVEGGLAVIAVEGKGAEPFGRSSPSGTPARAAACSVLRRYVRPSASTRRASMRCATSSSIARRRRSTRRSAIARATRCSSCRASAISRPATSTTSRASRLRSGSAPSPGTRSAARATATASHCASHG